MNKRKPPEDFDESPIWDEAMHARARPASEIHGADVVGSLVRKRGRPALAAGEHKEKVNLRLSPDVVAALRARGSGWQAHAEEILRRGLKLGDRPKPRRAI